MYHDEVVKNLYTELANDHTKGLELFDNLLYTEACLNRMSSYLFSATRYESYLKNQPEEYWQGKIGEIRP